MGNLRDSKGKEKMADYLHKKTLGKKNRQPDGGSTKKAESDKK
jgi:hypothetical protein